MSSIKSKLTTVTYPHLRFFAFIVAKDKMVGGQMKCAIENDPRFAAGNPFDLHSIRRERLTAISKIEPLVLVSYP